jgi:hypothetical protein
MRRTILWIGGARAFTVVGFAGILAVMLWFAATAPPTTMSSSAAFAQYGPGSSSRSTFNETFDTCTGESVQIQGTVHMVSHTTTDANGRSHTTFHLDIQGRGESASGAKYVFHQVVTQHVNSSGPPPFNVTLTQSSKLIRQGSANPTDDLTFKLLVHLTVNAQGESTSEVVKAESECK